MLFFFDKAGNHLTNYGTNKAYPEGIPDEKIDLDLLANERGVLKSDILIYRLHDERDKEKVDAILNLGSIEGVITEGVVTDVIINKRISVTTDKMQITANGADTATIIATVDDPTSTESIELYQNDLLVDSQTALNGVAIFQITMSQPGTLTLTVKSTTKYGQADIQIEGV